jgi:hypothetical protein
MWSLEDVQALNPADSRQDVSFLSHVLGISAATEESLCSAAMQLEAREGPYVVAFAQLPFTIDVGSQTFKVQGWREGVVVELKFTRVAGAFTQNGTLRVLDTLAAEASALPDGLKRLEFTQITAVIRLWNKRAELHEAYLNYLTSSGLRNQVIGRVEGWMDAPEASMRLPARRYAPLTAQAFQSEVARRVRTELLHATQSFLRAYTIANLESLPNGDVLYGYFIMVAPGRIASASPPLPIAAGLCAAASTPQSPGPEPERLVALLDRSLPFEDRFLVQLMAMHRLLKLGEPELALIGCVTAVEWFLNEKFSDLVQRTRAGKAMSASITACLRSGALEFMPQPKRDLLRELALARNAIVHGPPPSRSGHHANPHRTTGAVEPEYVRSSLFTALDLYREINMRETVAQ